MRRTSGSVLPILVLFFLSSCQPQSTLTITIIDGDQIRRLSTTERVPASLLAQVDIHLAANDSVLLNGRPVAFDQALPPAPTDTLQVRRAVALTINGKTVQTAASTVGEALSQAGLQLYASDQISPPVQTAITKAMTVEYVPARVLTVMADGAPFQIRASAATVASALAEGGIPLLGLDSSRPSENDALPSSGQLQITRISESILLSERSIPFKTDYQQSASVDLDQRQIIQAGRPGLSVSRVRIVYQDGKEISRQDESGTIVRAPQDEIVGYGTKVVMHTATVNGVQIQYWRAEPMYATAYSPCNSASGGCSYGTSSGLPAGKGVVAVDPSMYSLYAGQHLYIPGYGMAVVGDVGGGYIIEQKLGISRSRWIDLGYSDTECKQACDQWSTWVTVYFLAPPPASIPPLN
ncbi:MAG TPA: ubiquitin-like domain-containing protein [Anaerolineales bacterium]|nr:ubiquitin-like domain-containing protein [Anaerolineales bacterium]